MATDCRVWDLYQARCMLCGWSGEITGISLNAVWEAQDHRKTDEHKRRLRERRDQRTSAAR